MKNLRISFPLLPNMQDMHLELAEDVTEEEYQIILLAKSPDDTIVVSTMTGVVTFGQDLIRQSIMFLS